MCVLVRNEKNHERKMMRESEILKEEVDKRIEERRALRDKGMAHCFDADIMKRFIVTINKSESFNLGDFL